MSGRHSHSRCDRGPSADSSHLSAIPDGVAAPQDLRRGTRQARYCCRRSSGPVSHWGKGPATSRARPGGALRSHGRSPGPPPFRSPGPPRVPRTFWCAHPHSDQGVRGRPTPLLPPGHCRTTGAIFARPRTEPRTTVTRAAFPQYAFYGVRPLYPRDLRGNDDFHIPTHVHRPSL